MSAMPTLYGIKNCDTMKKARTWLDQRGVAYEFHDYKTAGIERGTSKRKTPLDSPGRGPYSPEA